MHLWVWAVGFVVWVAAGFGVGPLMGAMLRESRERGEGE